ncbi:DUF6228 family protein [Nocardia rhamnosiphila]
MIDLDESGEFVLAIRSDTDYEQPDNARLEFRSPRRPHDDEYVIDFLVEASSDSARVELSVCLLDCDGFVEFLDDLAESFRGWYGVRTWHSIDHELTLSAEHHDHVHLLWGLSRRAVPGTPQTRLWSFETTTIHAPGESMRTLAADVRAFLDAAS